MDEVPGSAGAPPVDDRLLAPPVDDRMLASFLESVGAGSLLPHFRASGLSDQSLHEISTMNSQAIHELFSLSLEQADGFLLCVCQYLTNQFLERETIEIRSVVESAGFDYTVFASVDSDTQQEILNSLKRRRTQSHSAPSEWSAPSGEPGLEGRGWEGANSYDFAASAPQGQQAAEHSSRVSMADMSAEDHGSRSASHSQLDVAVSILAEFFPSMQAEAIADMLHSMGLRLDEAVDTILEDMPSSSLKRKSSSHTSTSRLDAVRQLGAARSGFESADWKGVYSWISASTGQSPGGAVASADTSLESLVAFMKVAMNVDDPAAGAEQVANMICCRMKVIVTIRH